MHGREHATTSPDGGTYTHIWGRQPPGNQNAHLRGDKKRREGPTLPRREREQHKKSLENNRAPPTKENILGETLPDKKRAHTFYITSPGDYQRGSSAAITTEGGAHSSQQKTAKIDNQSPSTKERLLREAVKQDTAERAHPGGLPRREEQGGGAIIVARSLLHRPIITNAGADGRLSPPRGGHLMARAPAQQRAATMMISSQASARRGASYPRGLPSPGGAPCGRCEKTLLYINFLC